MKRYIVGDFSIIEEDDNGELTAYNPNYEAIEISDINMKYVVGLRGYIDVSENNYDIIDKIYSDYGSLEQLLNTVKNGIVSRDSFISSFEHLLKTSTKTLVNLDKVMKILDLLSNDSEYETYANIVVKSRFFPLIKGKNNMGAYLYDLVYKNRQTKSIVKLLFASGIFNKNIISLINNSSLSNGERVTLKNILFTLRHTRPKKNSYTYLPIAFLGYDVLDFYYKHIYAQNNRNKDELFVRLFRDYLAKYMFNKDMDSIYPPTIECFGSSYSEEFKKRLDNNDNKIIDIIKEVGLETVRGLDSKDMINVYKSILEDNRPLYIYCSEKFDPEARIAIYLFNTSELEKEKCVKAYIMENKLK